MEDNTKKQISERQTHGPYGLTFKESAELERMQYNPVFRLPVEYLRVYSATSIPWKQRGNQPSATVKALDIGPRCLYFERMESEEKKLSRSLEVAALALERAHRTLAATQIDVSKSSLLVALGCELNSVANELRKARAWIGEAQKLEKGA